MQKGAVLLEMYRWGWVNIPGVLFTYAKELNLDMEDLGIINAIIYTYQKTKPLTQNGVEVGLVLESCSALTRQKLSRKLTSLHKAGLVSFLNEKTGFNSRIISLQPLIAKLESLIIRDHPQLHNNSNHVNAVNKSQIEKLEDMLDEYRFKIEQLELKLEENKQLKTSNLPVVTSPVDSNYKRVADFVARKTGNLLSVKMSNELRVWLEEMGFTTEYLLVLLELCFERKITNPSSITKIARDLKEYSINSLEGLEMYFKKYVDTGRHISLHIKRFDPDIIEFGNYTGIDMTAEARRKIYYKWRYDWGFSHAMIMKAGEVMCQRTKNGGLEYMDSVLNNWMSKEIRQVHEVDQEVKEFKERKKIENNKLKKSKANNYEQEYQVYIAPEELVQARNKG